MMTRRKLVLCGGLLALFAVVLTFGGCSPARDAWEDVPGERPNVLVSFPPLYCFAANVAGEHARVLSLLTTVGPHDFSPSGRDVLKARKADLFLVNGLGLDDWFSKIANSSGNSRLKVVEVGETLPEDKLLDAGAEEHDHGHGRGEEGHHHHHHGDHDPHVWLGIDQAMLMVEKIRAELSAAAPEHKAAYQDNASRYLEQLKQLREYGQKKFAGCKNRNIIATHDSLGYFAKTFDLKVIENLMPQPGVEASGAKLAELVKAVKEHNVQAITVEPQYSQATAQTLQKQLQKELGRNIPLVTFNTLETVEGNLDKDYYINQMQDNIDALAKALK